MGSCDGARITVDDGDGSIRLVARHIGIVGAGPAGLAAARMFLDENDRARAAHQAEVPFLSVTVLERNGAVGGVWNYTPEAKCRYSVPQAHPEDIGLDSRDERSATSGMLPTPMYDQLHSNLTKDVMQFTDHPFPDTVPDFPSRTDVLKYLEGYAATHVLAPERPEFNLRLNTEVVDLAFDAGDAQWTCVVRDPGDLLQESLTFDAVLLCVGHCDYPYIPDIPGIGELAAHRRCRVMHAKEYRQAADFAGKSVLVVGGNSSGSDISRQLSYAASAVHVSARELTDAEHAFTPRVGDGCCPSAELYRHPSIACITADSVQFTDGTSIGIPDVVLFATGYISAFPFLRQTPVPPLPPLDPRPSDSGDVVHNLFRMLIYAPNPLLSVVSFPTLIVPFPLAEYQAMYLAQVYQGNLALPPVAQMLESCQVASASRHQYVLGMAQIEYRNAIVDEIAEAAADGRTHPPRFGHVPKYWDDLAEYTLARRLASFGF
ncbi:monooxygenase [Coemansia nantahalensis]|nr:monooxygenase [Coemansia nantahalensis]